MSDYYLSLKIQNGRVRAAMARKGIPNVAALTRAMGSTNFTDVGLYINFKKYPQTKDGKWRSAIIKMAEVLGELPEDLFPEELMEVKKKNSFEVYVDEAKLRSMVSPDDALEYAELKADIDRVISTVKQPREKKMLELYFKDGFNFREIGAIFGICGANVQHRVQRTLCRIHRAHNKVGLLEEY